MIAELSRGLVYKEIAHKLGLSASTVRTHLHNTFRKLGVSDRAQAILLAKELAGRGGSWSKCVRAI